MEPSARSVVRPLTLFAVVTLALSAAAAIHAAPTKIFVASYGNDANSGTPASPKRGFQAAHDSVAADGQIVVLDTAGYGALNIPKSVAVTRPPGVNGFVTAPSGGSGITINAGATDKVALRGLIIEGPGSGGGGFVGINGSSFGTLSVESCTVRNFGDGLFINPNNRASVSVRDTVVRNTVVGFDLDAVSTNSNLDATLTDCTVENTSGA